MTRLGIALALSISLFTNLQAGDEFTWLPVTQQDWAVTRDSSRGGHDAVMIFEKVLADEHNLENKECFLRVYRRIKIFSREGKGWATVSIPYESDHSKVRAIAARTILPNGTILNLANDQILEKEIFKTEDTRINEKFFTLPGVTDSCIIDYYFETQNEKMNSIWVVQKDIPVLRWEYDWRYYQPQVYRADFWQRYLYSQGAAPNYLWSANQQKFKIVTLPASGHPEEAVFSLDSVPPFEPEPYTLPDLALETRLQFYYGSTESPSAYWSFVSAMVAISNGMFESKQDRIKELAKEFSNISDPDNRIASAYHWLQEHIKNITFETHAKDYEINKNCNDVLEHAYGTAEDINLVFRSILESLGFKPGLVYLARRDEHLFYEVARYWQFDLPVVVLTDARDHSHYYSPGSEFAEPGEVPWYFEGTRGLNVYATVGQHLIANIPSSPPDSNALTQEIQVCLSDTDQSVCTIDETRTGHAARDLKIQIGNASRSERNAIVKKALDEMISADWKDSITITSFTETPGSVRIQYRIRGPIAQIDADGKTLFKPFSMFTREEDPFTADTRKYPITFRYATSVSRNFTLALDKRWKAEALPLPTEFLNKIGTLNLSSIAGQDTLRIISRCSLREPIYSENLYPQVRSFYQERTGLMDATIPLSLVPIKK